MSNQEMTYEQAREILSLTAEEVEAMGATDILPLGKYGLLARDYLKEHLPWRYEYLMLEMTLMDVLRQVDNEAREMMDVLQAQLRGQTPRPKGDFMATVRYETAIRDQAEEIVLREIVYKPR